MKQYEKVIHKILISLIYTIATWTFIKSFILNLSFYKYFLIEIVLVLSMKFYKFTLEKFKLNL